MIKLTELYTAANSLLEAKYPNIKIYGNEVKEGYNKPSFFVELRPKKRSNDSMRFKSLAYTIIITYFQDQPNEIDNLTKIDEITEIFGYKLSVNDRKIAVTESDFQFVGDDNDILQLSIEIEYLEAVERTDLSQKAGSLILKAEKR
ncbi:MAG: hypothetical protein K0R00_900 [Herbinix sp.]|jgi:hypothetical protein|nr:hypothetical protein [Herbinix sp.]